MVPIVIIAGIAGAVLLLDMLGHERQPKQSADADASEQPPTETKRKRGRPKGAKTRHRKSAEPDNMVQSGGATRQPSPEPDGDGGKPTTNDSGTATAAVSGVNET